MTKGERNLLLIANGYNYKCHLLGNRNRLCSRCNLLNLLFLALEGGLLYYVLRTWIRSLEVVQDSAFETKHNIKSLYSPRYREEQEQGRGFHAAAFAGDSEELGCVCQRAARYKTKRYCYVKKQAADLAQDETSKGRIKGFMFRSASLDQMLSLKGWILIQTQVFQRSSCLLKSWLYNAAAQKKKKK